jgi:hypothetical protein
MLNKNTKLLQKQEDHLPNIGLTMQTFYLEIVKIAKTMRKL